MSRNASLASLSVLSLGFVVLGCGGTEGNNVSCGDGTHLEGTTCVSNGATDGGADGDETTPLVKGPKFDGITSLSSASATSLFVTWNPATDALTATALIKYRVYVGTTAGGQNYSAATLTSPPGASSVLLTGLTPGSEYFVVVRAVNALGEEDTNKVEKSAKALDDSKPPVFDGATKAESADGSAVKLSWTAAKDEITAPEGLVYLVYYATDAGKENLTVPSFVSAPGATSIVVKGLPKPKTKYYFKVRARDAAGNTDLNTVEVSADSGPDVAPPVFSGCIDATTKDAVSITVRWNPATDDVTPQGAIRYNVYGGKDAKSVDFTKPLATFTGGDNGLVSGLKPSTEYFLVCKAQDAADNEDENKSVWVAKTSEDGTPPNFLGLDSVTNVTATTADLAWKDAIDDKSATADIVYDVYESTTAGGQDFTAPPRATSEKGATKMTLTGISPATKLFWVVRARDAAGNRDSNKVEKNGTTAVSFSLNVQTIFTANCATGTCHRGTTPAAGLSLVEGVSYTNTVGVAASGKSGAIRIVKSNSAGSYLYQKVTNAAGIVGELMPPPASGGSLSPAEKDLLKAWIDQGALNN